MDVDGPPCIKLLQSMIQKEVENVLGYFMRKMRQLMLEIQMETPRYLFINYY